MNHKKRMILICFFCAIMLALASCGKTETSVREVTIEDMLLLKSGSENEQNLCVVHQTDEWFYLHGVVPGEYVVLITSVMKVKTIPNAEDAGAKIGKLEKLEYWFYDVHTKEKLKVIDVKDKLEERDLAKQWQGYQLVHRSLNNYAFITRASSSI